MNEHRKGNELPPERAPEGLLTITTKRYEVISTKSREDFLEAVQKVVESLPSGEHTISLKGITISVPRPSWEMESPTEVSTRKRG